MATAKKLPSGKYRCRASYTDEFGNYKTKSFTAATKKEAENLGWKKKDGEAGQLHVVAPGMKTKPWANWQMRFWNPKAKFFLHLPCVAINLSETTHLSLSLMLD